jgi:hypothetical protein
MTVLKGSLRALGWAERKTDKTADTRSADNHRSEYSAPKKGTRESPQTVEEAPEGAEKSPPRYGRGSGGRTQPLVAQDFR